MPRPPKPPSPLAQPPDLSAFLRLCGVEGYNGNLGRYYRCPHCQGRPRNSRPGRESVPASDTLRIHLNLANELVLHCGNCGRVGSALDWFRQAETGPSDWDGVRRVLEARQVFGDRPVPEDWLERGKLRERFFSLFEQAKARYRTCAHTSSLCPVNPFGEVGIVEHRELRQDLPILSVGGNNRRARYYLELRRSLSGLPLQVSLRAFRSSYDQIRFIWLEPEEPFLVLAPEGGLHRDWRKGVVIATDPWVARRLESWIGQRPVEKQPPLIQVVQAKGPFPDEIPYASVLYVHGKEESPDFGLALAHGGTSVRVASIEEVADEIENAGDVFRLGRAVIALTTEAIVQKAGSRKAVIPYLEAVCSRPWVTTEIRERLAHVVASKTGEPLDRLVARTGTGTQVLSFRATPATYLCRNGIYLKATDRDRQQFEPLSNFSLRIDESFTDEEERLSHRVTLRMGTDSTKFPITDADFERGDKLMEAATHAAVAAGFPSYPRLTDSGEVKILPAMVKATQTRAPLVTPPPSRLGFGPSRFHGANFTVTARGVRFRDRHEAGKKCQARWMLPEEPGGIGEDHLTFQANELATWVGEQQFDQQRLIGAMLYAALAWLHRGSRGLASHLLVPSAGHLEILGQLLGLVPIEVGRGQPDQPGVPRLMKSLYWKSSQFHRQGRIVAAIEDPNRRIDEEIPLVLCRREEVEFPEPTSSYLSLLAFSCLGSKNPRAETAKLTALCECRDATTLDRLIRRGSWFFCRPGRYLKCFLSAVRRHCDPEEALIESRGRTLLRRSVVDDLERSQGYGFRESRLVTVPDEGSVCLHPTRFGRDRIPVFATIDGLLS